MWTSYKIVKNPPSVKRTRDKFHVNHLFTSYAPLTKKNGLIWFPVTEEFRLNLLAVAFSLRLESDVHCFSTDTGSHLLRLAVMFEKQLLSSSLPLLFPKYTIWAGFVKSLLKFCLWTVNFTAGKTLPASHLSSDRADTAWGDPAMSSYPRCSCNGRRYQTHSSRDKNPCRSRQSRQSQAHCLSTIFSISSASILYSSSNLL